MYMRMYIITFRCIHVPAFHVDAYGKALLSAFSLSIQMSHDELVQYIGSMEHQVQDTEVSVCI